MTDDASGEREREEKSVSWLDRRRLLEMVGAGAALSALPTAAAHDQVYTEADDQPGTSESVDSLVEEMTLEEKVRKVHNHFGSGAPDPPIGYMSPVGRLDVPAMEIADGPVGVRHPQLVNGTSVEPEDMQDWLVDGTITDAVIAVISGGPSTAFPATTALASTWDRDVMREFGFAMGREAKAKGQGSLFAPGVNIMRIPEGGRTFEYFGEDPYLVGRAGVFAIRGMQSAGTIACVKHYAVNNHETNRMTVSAAVGERALREIYLPAFRAAVEEADVGSVMAAYNRVNGTYCTEHDYLLSDVLKGEWGFEGYVVSDYGATDSTVPAANAGLDYEAPTDEHFGEELRRAVENGDVDEAVLDDKVRRILETQERFGILGGDRVGPSGEANTRGHQLLARQIAAEGGVLLKNDESVLPFDLDEVGSIAVVGHGADEAKVGGGGSSNITPPYSISPLAGIRERADADTVVTYVSGETSTEEAVLAAQSADAAVVVADGSATEGEDRDDLELTGNQNELVSEVAAANDRTAVVLRTGGPVVMPWVDDVPAILEMWYPGMEDGTATAQLLFGDVNPSGKLPMTFGERREDYPATAESEYPGVDRGDGYPVAEYSEGVYVGYRHFDEEGIEPLFPFGHGLSYAEFEYGDLTVTPTRVRPNEDVDVTVEVTVENVGDRAGKEAVQLYVGADTAVDRPPKELKEFARVRLAAGESRTVAFHLDRDAFSHYDVGEGAWVVESGSYDVLVGASSRDVRLRESVSVRRDRGGD